MIAWIIYSVATIAFLVTFACFCISLNRDMKDLERKVKYLNLEMDAMRSRITELMGKEDDLK